MKDQDRRIPLTNIPLMKDQDRPARELQISLLEAIVSLLQKRLLGLRVLDQRLGLRVRGTMQMVVVILAFSSPKKMAVSMVLTAISATCIMMQADATDGT